MSGQRHPDAEALANLQAGLVDGSQGRRLAAHVADCARCASVTDQLSEVSSALAAAPALSMPAAFANQVTAALAAEAAARASNGSVHAAVPAAATEPAPEPGPTRVRRRLRPARTWRTRYGLRIRLAYAVPAVACVLAGFGYLASQLAGTAAVPSTAASSASSAYAAPAAGNAPVPSPDSRSAPESLSSHVPFFVTTSGISYLPATLRQQVAAEVATHKSAALETPVPSAAAASASASAPNGEFGTASGVAAQSTRGTAPSTRLIGCVLKLTHDVAPSLVDQATYQGRSVYVIAVPDRVWVVGLGCTASKPDLITSAPLGTAG
jgi:hypothetical protein